MKRLVACLVLGALVPAAVSAQSPAATPAPVVEQDVCVGIDGPPLTSQQDLLDRLEAGIVTIVLAPCRPESFPTPVPSDSPAPTAQTVFDLVHDSWPTIRRTYRRADRASLGALADGGRAKEPPLYLHGRVTGSGAYKAMEHYYLVSVDPADGSEPFDVMLYDRVNLGPTDPHRPIPVLRRGDVIDAVVRADGEVPDDQVAAVAYRLRIVERAR